MKTYVINSKTKIVHVAIDGRTHEQCNVDQIKHKVSIDPNSVLMGKSYRMCKHCA